MKLTQEIKDQIDTMSQYSMAHKWRFAKIGDPLLQGEVGDYFCESFKNKGGMTPEISKDLGW